MSLAPVDPSIDYDYGGELWYEDTRNISALAGWLVDNGGTAAQVYEVFEHAPDCNLLWEAFVSWSQQGLDI